MKKITLMLVAAALILCSCASSTNNSDPTGFDAWVKEKEVELITGTTNFNMNFLCNDPAALGLPEAETYGLGFASLEETMEIYDDYEQWLEEMAEFDQEELSETQLVTYKAFEDYLNRELALKNYYYYDNDMIGSYSSVLQELPLLLEMYTFNDTADLENYFKDITAFKDDFLACSEFEKERQARGLGYSEDILADTRDQIQGIIDEGGKEMTEVINQNIAALDFLSQEEKISYQKRNETAIQVELMGAYQALLDDLSTFKGAAETTGLYDKPDGQAYYEAMIYNQLGIKKDISDIEDDLLNMFNEKYEQLASFVTDHYDLMSVDDIYDITYAEFSTPQEGLDYLKTKIFAVVPEIDHLNYRIYQVPDSLKDGFAPAAYLSSRVDMSADQPECIMINPDNTENIFPTLVHEGYPGHMYQNAYLRSLNYPTLNYLLDCIGYTEGWAIYMENQAATFLEEEADWQTLLTLNEQVTNPLLSLMDIGIHYYGWSFDDCFQFLNETAGTDDPDAVRRIYDIIVQTPAYYLYYIYSGELFNQYYETAKEACGSHFDVVEFNRVLLNSGPVGMDVVKDNVDQYISQNK